MIEQLKTRQHQTTRFLIFNPHKNIHGNNMGGVLPVFGANLDLPLDIITTEESSYPDSGIQVV